MAPKLAGKTGATVVLNASSEGDCEGARGVPGGFTRQDRGANERKRMKARGELERREQRSQ